MNCAGIAKRLAGSSTRAFTLVETVVALAIATLAIGGAMSINSHQLRIVKATRLASAASHSLQERIEQVRTATWAHVTDPAYVADTLFATVPRSLAPLGNYVETITFSPWSDQSGVTAGPVMCVEKTPKSPAQIIKDGNGIAAVPLVKVEVRIRWNGSDNHEHFRLRSTIISNGGISRVNLPAMGPLGGGIWDDFSKEPTVNTGTGDSGNGNSGGNSGGGNSGGNSGGGNSGRNSGGGNSGGNSGGGNSGGNSGGGNSGDDSGSDPGTVGGKSGKK